MSQNRYNGEREPIPEEQPGKQRQRFLGVTYRLVIIFGIVLLAVWFVLVVFTSFVPFWSLVFPLVFIIVGIILARFEYALHQRINQKE